MNQENAYANRNAERLAMRRSLRTQDSDNKKVRHSMRLEEKELASNVRIDEVAENRASLLFDLTRDSAFMDKV